MPIVCHVCYCAVRATVLLVMVPCAFRVLSAHQVIDCVGLSTHPPRFKHAHESPLIIAMDTHPTHMHMSQVDWSLSRLNFPLSDYNLAEIGGMAAAAAAAGIDAAAGVVDADKQPQLDSVQLMQGWGKFQRDLEGCGNGPGPAGSSQYKGVVWLKKEKKWKAQLAVGGRANAVGYSLGNFDDETEAARARDRGLLQLCGTVRALPSYGSFGNVVKRRGPQMFLHS